MEIKKMFERVDVLRDKYYFSIREVNPPWQDRVYLDDKSLRVFEMSGQADKMENVTEIFASLCRLMSKDWPGIHVKLYLDENEKNFTRFRQLAYAVKDEGKLEVAISPKLESMSHLIILGVLAHELGHILDFSVPRAQLAFFCGKLPETPERRADVIAEAVFGFGISYDKNDIQTIGSGTRPRPERLGL